MHILLVDDEADNRLTMKAMLELHGHFVELAENGREAVEIATRHVPDVVVMDLGMPVMDGITATRILRERAETLAVPVVCVSAYLAQSEWCARAYEAGCVACMMKPVHWPEFVALLAGLSGARDSQQD
jgi:CheY-like chemotaxis protein